MARRRRENRGRDPATEPERVEEAVPSSGVTGSIDPGAASDAHSALAEILSQTTTGGLANDAAIEEVVSFLGRLPPDLSGIRPDLRLACLHARDCLAVTYVIGCIARWCNDISRQQAVLPPEACPRESIVLLPRLVAFARGFILARRAQLASAADAVVELGGVSGESVHVVALQLAERMLQDIWMGADQTGYVRAQHEITAHRPSPTEQPDLWLNMELPQINMEFVVAHWPRIAQQLIAHPPVSQDDFHTFSVRLVREAVQAAAALDPQDPLVPVWDSDAGELRLGAVVVRRVRGGKPGKNLRRVLAAFQEDGWPSRIDDPLPGGQKQLRLHATIRSLNIGLQLIRFEADGTGAGFRWRRL